MKYCLLTVMIFASFISCSSYDLCNQYAISYGMSTDEVKEILGYPDRVFTWFDTTHFIYVCGQQELWIGFDSGIVSSIEFEKRYF